LLEGEGFSSIYPNETRVLLGVQLGTLQLSELEWLGVRHSQCRCWVGFGHFASQRGELCLAMTH
jgi:hypothetical protein